MRHGGTEESERVRFAAEEPFGVEPASPEAERALLAGGGGGTAGYWNEPLALISELEKELKAPQRALAVVEQFVGLLPRYELSVGSKNDLAQVCDLLDRVQSELVVAYTRNLLQQAKENVALYEKRLEHFNA